MKPAAALAIALSLFLCGCASTSPGSAAGSGGRGEINELHLFGIPVALTTGSGPAPDGIGLRVYATSAEVPKGQEIQKGKLEILMYDGVVSSPEAPKSPPRHIWTFTPQQLKPFEGQTSLGIGYRLVLKWEADKPKAASVTVFGRYTPPRGVPVYSAASPVSIQAK